MFKIKQKIVFGLLLMSTAMIFMNYQVKADNGEAIFDQQTLEEVESKIEGKRIFQDKSYDGSENIKAERRPTGVYPTRKGVILVTKDKYKDLIPTGHAAIIYTKTSVIESLSKGVVKGKKDWNKTKTTCYGVTVKSTEQEDDEKVADWCKKRIGKPYNYNYLDVKTRKKFYCSQLVWAGYKDLYKIDLNTDAFGDAIHPTELVATSKTYKIYEK